MLSGLLQGQCVVCHAWGNGRVCGSCMALFATRRPRCQRCGLMLASGQPVCGRCLSQPPPLTATHVAVDYAFPWDALLQRFKFHAALELQRPLAGLLLAALDGAEPVDAVLPMPLSEARQLERGFNQAQLLARPVARRLKLPCRTDCLLRVRESARQAELDLPARRANVRGVFAVDARHAAALRGRRIAVVDDVMTSGATLFEAARVLLSAGAAEVQAWVLARTPG